jgi:small subunit ribosomal protein S17
MADENTENTPEEVEAVTEDATEATEAEAPVTEEKGPEGPDPSLSPVQRRAWHRQRSGATANPSRTPEERARERAEARKAKAVARRRRRLQEREKKAAKLGDAAGTDRGTPKPEHEPGRKQVRQGVVLSAKGEKTLVIRIDHSRRHPKYRKIVRHTSKLYAHDEQNSAGVGDVVRIESCRPLSRTKRWTLAEIVERAK